MASPPPRYTVALGGIGADSHSVGLTLLRHTLHSANYEVLFLGIQNDLRDFFQVADAVDVVMISTLDGHSKIYTREFPTLALEYRASSLWYIGGNLGLSGDAPLVRHYSQLGFTRIFTAYVEADYILQCLRSDLSGRPPRGAVHLSGLTATASAAPFATLADHAVQPTVFLAERSEVLQQWRTGSGASDLDDNAAFLVRSPMLSRAQQKARAARQTLVQPRSGVASRQGQLALLTALGRGGADVLSYQVDSLSRLGDFEGAENAIRASTPAQSMLNGFPIVNHGVGNLRSMARQIATPLQLRHSARDPRILAEISYAAGVSGFEGGCVSYNLPYYRDYPLTDSIRRWQYVDRLTGWYAEHYGIVLDREFFGVLTGTLIPPCLAIVVNLIEMLLAVSQGVCSVSLGYAEQGCRAQDIASIQVLDEWAHDLARGMGHSQVIISVVFHQYMAAFPTQVPKAEQLIIASAETASLARATRIITKTPTEAQNVPDLRSNLRGLALVRQGFHQALDPLTHMNVRAIESEKTVIRAEVEQLLASVFALGRGQLARGVVNAFASGALDIPFSPSRHNRGKVLTARDASGAVRFLSTGNLELSSDLRAFHRDRMEERRADERLARSVTDTELAGRDIQRILTGDFSDWPLDLSR